VVANAIEDEVITLPTFGEILFSVINHPVRADGTGRVRIPRTAYARHIRAERPGELHRERTHTACRTVNQNSLPVLVAIFRARVKESLGACT
jgi:hypothetical protein